MMNALPEKISKNPMGDRKYLFEAEARHNYSLQKLKELTIDT